jgi:two-component system LytT family response regulator
MKVLILDDEPPARRNLKHALSEIGVDDVREAGSIEQAVKALQEDRPDVLLLDVELRGGKQGFDLLDALPAEGIPAIFVTAHPEHAVRAFEERAVDYLLKPVDTHRLRESLGRIGSKSVGPERVFLKHETAMFRDGSKNVLVRIGDIQLLEANDSYTKLVLGDGKGPMVNGTLKSVLQRIDPAAFFQTDRARAINLDHVARIEDGESGLAAVLSNGMRVEMSRRQSTEFRRLKAI